MPSFVLTGAPGAGKTAVLRMLETRGYPVVEEAATDVIAIGNAMGRDEPWHDHDFINQVVTLQRQRQTPAPTPAPTPVPKSAPAAGIAGAADGATVFFDRSPVCTLALSRYLGLAASDLLASEVGRVVAEGTYETTVFFIRNQGFIQATAARRISFEDSLVFERLHEQAYRELGFRLVEVPAGPLADRAALIQETISQRAAGRLTVEAAHRRR